jgi:hypothetical protein
MLFKSQNKQARLSLLPDKSNDISGIDNKTTSVKLETAFENATNANQSPDTNNAFEPDDNFAPPMEYEDEDTELDMQQKILDDRVNVCYTRSDVAEVGLLKLLNDANTPHYLFQQIINWAKVSKEMSYDFNPVRTNRTSQISHIENWFGLSYMKPKQKMLKVPGLKAPGEEDVIPVTCFDFTSMLHSLLTDMELFVSLENLNVNLVDPFQHYKGKSSNLHCANGGTWYKDAWKNLCKQEEDFLVPIIFSCDETTMGKCGACPLLFTTTLLKQKLRNKPSAWRPLGFIYDLKLITSKKQGE